MKIALVSDAWSPQVNGVVRTLETTAATLRARGHHIEPITPDGFRTIACPTYPEIRLALGCGRAVADRLERAAPDAVHIATEGSLGWAARKWCLANNLPFTTSFHTRFPDYVAMRTGLPASWFWPILERFHRPAEAIMVATETLASELAAHGLTQTRRWSRGVDLSLFRPGRAAHPALASLPGPIQLYAGRVACEKNIEAFLASRVPGTKVVVGDGPARVPLQRRFPEARFLGALHGEALAAVYAGADVFVFPSHTDTFGLVMIEALASGVPVAAFPVPGPLDVIGGLGRGLSGRAGAQIGALRHDLDAAIIAALDADRMACAVEGRRYSWDACTDQFFTSLAPLSPPLARAA
jgi:glycosyltransferase involved in cell wall biosynthesis